MRFAFRIIFFPITLLLTLIVAVMRLFCHLSTMVLGSMSFIIFLIGLAVMVLLQDYKGGFQIIMLSFLLGPFGLPFIISFIVELIGLFNDSLKTV